MTTPEQHHRENPHVYWAGKIHTARDMDHLNYLIDAEAWEYLARAERGEISLRDAVGALKREDRRNLAVLQKLAAFKSRWKERKEI